MKRGTIFCKLFGHKFVISDYWVGRQYLPSPTDFCVRCGIKEVQSVTSDFSSTATDNPNISKYY